MLEYFAETDKASLNMIYRLRFSFGLFKRWIIILRIWSWKRSSKFPERWRRAHQIWRHSTSAWVTSVCVASSQWPSRLRSWVMRSSSLKVPVSWNICTEYDQVYVLPGSRFGSCIWTEMLAQAEVEGTNFNFRSRQFSSQNVTDISFLCNVKKWYCCNPTTSTNWHDHLLWPLLLDCAGNAFIQLYKCEYSILFRKYSRTPADSRNFPVVKLPKAQSRGIFNLKPPLES